MEKYKHYLRYARDLDDIDPVVALCCRSYYLTKYIEAKRKTKMTAQESANIKDLLNIVENIQKKLELTKEQREKKVEEFCIKLFECIVEDDLSAMEISENHAIQFNTTADVIELLKVFGSISNEWEDKRRYCKYKALVIYKCIKDNTEIPRGRPCDAPQTFNDVLNPVEVTYPSLSGKFGMNLEESEPRSVDSRNESKDVVIPRTNMGSMILPPNYLAKLDNRDEGKMEDIKKNTNDNYVIPNEDVIIPLIFPYNKHPPSQLPPHKISKEDQITSSINKEVEFAIGELQFKRLKSAKECIKKALARLDYLS